MASDYHFAFENYIAFAQIHLLCNKEIRIQSYQLQVSMPTIPSLYHSPQGLHKVCMVCTVCTLCKLSVNSCNKAWNVCTWFALSKLWANYLQDFMLSSIGTVNSLCFSGSNVLSNRGVLWNEWLKRPGCCALLQMLHWSVSAKLPLVFLMLAPSWRREACRTAPVLERRHLGPVLEQ